MERGESMGKLYLPRICRIGNALGRMYRECRGEEIQHEGRHTGLDRDT